MTPSSRAGAVLASPDQMRAHLRRAARLKGRQPEDQALEEVREWIGAGPWRRDLLIEYLHLLNDRCRGLHQRHLVALARLMNLPMAEVYEVASFYHHFAVLAEGETGPALTVRVCDGLSCELAGARSLLERLPALLGREVRVVPAPCLGRCEQAPAVLVGQAAVPSATPAAVQALIDAPAGTARSHAATEFVPYAAYQASGGYALAAALAEGRRDPGAVLEAMEASGLRGLGGAGFPAGRKWRIVREQPAPRLLAVNIDEGEPGTFKDRHYL
ncbi:MAG TPA: NAD(P)H-dependent oxidoreductase subunit E, partial [Ramlibacter sp.]|nr:NAD(P)H-dependent oxidoreductase subunit E [Ramlibacter sp.]